MTVQSDVEERMRSTPWKVVAIVGALLLCAPATAAAAEKPVVTTGAASSIEPTTVVLNGTVTPRGATTNYYFQYGPSSLYGAVTPAAIAQAGSGRVRVSAPVSGLAPATTYHYRLVAQNRVGVARGKHRTFKTKPQPLGFSLAATPNPVSAGGATTLAGVLSGTNSDDRRIQVKSNPWPYTQGFLPFGNQMVTNADGSFSLPVLSVPVNTQFIVEMVARPDVVSTPLVIGATLEVTRRVRVVRRGERSGRLRFRGRIAPAVDGEQVLIQKLRLSDGVWVTVAETFARNGGDSSSRYRKTIRQRRGGRYRVLVNVDEGTYSPSSSRSILRRHIRD
jgi:hypothetical protein